MTTFRNPVWPESPPTCSLTGMLSFENEQASKAWNERNGSMPVLARWKCGSCGGVHHYSTLPSDTNGNHRAGTFAIPERILKHIPKGGVLTTLDDDTGYRRAERNQSKSSVVREQLKAGIHPKQKRKTAHK